MKTLCRFALIASIMIAVYGVAMLGLRHPWPVIIGLIITAIIAAKKGYIQLTAFGTARWADADDLRRAGIMVLALSRPAKDSAHRADSTPLLRFAPRTRAIRAGAAPRCVPAVLVGSAALQGPRRAETLSRT